MVVPVDVFAGEVDDLLARAFLPMLGIHGSGPSYGRRSPRPRRCRGCTPSRSWTGPGRAGPSVPAIPATGNDNRGRCGPRDARRAAAWRRPGPGIVSRRFGVRRRPGRVRHDHAVVAVDHRRKVHLSVAGLDLGDVREPLLVGSFGGEVPVDEVVRRGRDLALVRAVASPSGNTGDQPVLAHDPADHLLRDTRPERGLDPPVPVPAPGIGERPRHAGAQCF